MRRKKQIIMLVSVCLVLMVAVIPFISACAAPETTPAPTPSPAPSPSPTPAPTPTPTPEPEVFEFGFTASLPVVGPAMWFCDAFCDRVTERSNGELVIKMLGGPEVMAAKAQAEAIRTGVLEVGAVSIATRMEPYVPEVGVWILSRVGNAELRERGYVDWMAEMMEEKANVKYLGEGMITTFSLWTNIKVERPQELAGQRLGVGGLWMEFCKALGATPVFLEVPELHTGVERGLVDGFFQGQPDCMGMKQYEVVKYWIDHPYYNKTAAYGFCVNLDAWNSLPEHLQKIMMDTALEIEGEAPAVQEELYQVSANVFLDNGLERITFSPEDAKWYVDTAYEAIWADKKSKLSEESYNKLRKMLSEEG